MKFLEVLMVVLGEDSQLGLWSAAMDYPRGFLVVVVAEVAEMRVEEDLMIVEEGFEEALLQEVEVNSVGGD